MGWEAMCNKRNDIETGNRSPPRSFQYDFFSFISCSKESLSKYPFEIACYNKYGTPLRLEGGGGEEGGEASFFDLLPQEESTRRRRRRTFQLFTIPTLASSMFFYPWHTTIIQPKSPI